MDKAVEYFESNSPNTFEHHYYKYVSGNYDISQVEHLNKAEELRPNNTDVHVQQAAYNIIIDDQAEGIKYVDKLIESKRLGESAITYAEDLMNSAPENGVLVTHGFDDTYASWYVQNNDAVRKDVQLVSLDFLQSKDYQKSLEEKGIALPEEEVVGVNYLADFCKLNNDKEVAISLTTPKEYFEPIKDHLYVTGLVFEYHEEDFNNFFRNEVLWKSSLDKHLINESN